MATLGAKVMLKNDESYTASTDMGNVSYEVPSFHGTFPIPTEPGVSMHHPKFAAHAATDEAHKAAIQCAKGMAMLTLRVLTDAKLREAALNDFNDFDNE
jgi:metal-dependent amidase/aminoacylase/carboxypeptidase family protein